MIGHPLLSSKIKLEPNPHQNSKPCWLPRGTCLPLLPTCSSSQYLQKTTQNLHNSFFKYLEFYCIKKKSIWNFICSAMLSAVRTSKGKTQQKLYIVVLISQLPPQPLSICPPKKKKYKIYKNASSSWWDTLAVKSSFASY